MALQYGRDVLSVFDVWEDSEEFLAEVIVSGAAPQEELEHLIQESILGGSDDWLYLIECASSMRRSGYRTEHELDGRDILTYVGYVLDKSSSPKEAQPWTQTNRPITRAKQLERDIELHPPHQYVPQDNNKNIVSRSPSSKRNQRKTSHFWSEEQEPTQNASTKQSYYAKYVLAISAEKQQNTSQSYHPTSSHGIAIPKPAIELARGTTPCADVTLPPGVNSLHGKGHDVESSTTHYLTLDEVCTLEKGVKNSRPFASPYFCAPAPVQKRMSPKRPPRGTISSIPFPPLTSSSFGIVQEKVAHEPFWLLVAITFLIRTKGTQAIPIFYQVKDKFPTPAHIADPAIKEEILGMIRHLGLSVVRLEYMQRYARAFLEDPPRAGVKHKIKKYGKAGARPDCLDATAREEPEAWEIGHMTSGKYAIDSWRIFCRDELLGEAEDWNGKGREPEFQPEWMRVMPDDKELRAFLRWMWMREGWEWDPVTGERTVLREAMQKAVNEGMVGYDDKGGLKILSEDEPEHGA